MKQKTERMAILSCGLIVIGLSFFIYTFIHWLNYDSTSSAVVYSDLNNETNLLASEQFEETAINKIVISGNPFFPPLINQEQPGDFPDLFFTGLISGERRVAILEEVGRPDRSWIVQEGDQVLGAKVIRVCEAQIELSRNGEIIILKAQEGYVQ